MLMLMVEILHDPIYATPPYFLGLWHTRSGRMDISSTVEQKNSAIFKALSGLPRSAQALPPSQSRHPKAPHEELFGHDAASDAC